MNIINKKTPTFQFCNLYHVERDAKSAADEANHAQDKTVEEP